MGNFHKSGQISIQPACGMGEESGPAFSVILRWTELLLSCSVRKWHGFDRNSRGSHLASPGPERLYPTYGTVHPTTLVLYLRYSNMYTSV